MMRIPFLLLALAAAVVFGPVSEAAVYKLYTVTVTNSTVNGNILTINSRDRVFTNSTAADPSTYVLTNSTIGGSATNLYRHLVTYKQSSPIVDVRWEGTNVIKLVSIADGALVAGLTGTWGTLALSITTNTNTFVVKVPMQSTAEDTNTASLALKDLTEKSTNLVSASSSSMGNFVNTSTAQTVGGVKKMSSAFYLLDDLYLTNNGPLMRFHDGDGGADAKNTFISVNEDYLSFDFYNDALSDANTAFYIARSGYTPTGVIFISPVVATTLQGLLTNSYTTNCTFFGTVGVLSGGYLDGVGTTNLVTTNTTFTATNTVTGDLAFTESVITSLATGANLAVDFGTKVWIILQAGPAGAFSIAGIAGGRDGREYHVFNDTGQNLTITYNAGDPTPGNRIVTATGADLVSTGNCAFTIRYSATKSRWIVTSWEP